MHELIPLESSRAVAEATPNAMTRWERFSVEACKQCGRNRLLKISSPRAFGALLEDRDIALGTRWIAHPYRSMNHQTQQAKLVVDPTSIREGRIIIVIGPEGGFHSEELESACPTDGASFKLAVEYFASSRLSLTLHRLLERCFNHRASMANSCLTSKCDWRCSSYSC